MDWYQRTFIDTGRSAALCALLGFLITFVIVRTITRRIHAKEQEPEQQQGVLRDVHIGGVHIHHQVWGILLILASGMLAFRYDPQPPWAELLAAVFGAGAALTLDEFALWFYLNDVYWSAEGRTSLDAILVGGAVGVALLLQASPIGDDPADSSTALAYAGTVVLHFVTAGICVLKGKLATGIIGVVVPIVATVGAIRLAKPTSIWARRRYRAAKLARAGRRFDAAYQRRHNRFLDLLGGKPDRP
ncbi:hypothetical protein [Prauserella cavernicola]|uniref:Integral membrane protein n=1 Tax=Prauserella cavernicola TaxID=2800127 RepID=A0A934V8G6_9PSEU|nr:hypothetical protein [Prauserella cavernicola]MBK1787738.1 hypothetical protein [Prauserella cavernicola]